MIGTVDEVYVAQDGFYDQAPTSGPPSVCPAIRTTGSLGYTITSIAVHDAG